MNGFGAPVNRPRVFKVISPIEKKDGGTYWMRVGTGYPNKDQSINLYLDALPLNHKLQLREMDEEDLQGRGRKQREDGPAAPAGNTDIPF